MAHFGKWLGRCVAVTALVILAGCAGGFGGGGTEGADFGTGGLNHPDIATTPGTPPDLLSRAN